MNINFIYPKTLTPNPTKWRWGLRLHSWETKRLNHCKSAYKDITKGQASLELLTWTKKRSQGRKSRLKGLLKCQYSIASIYPV